MALSEANAPPQLAVWLTAHAGGAVRIDTITRLGGGAIQENYALSVTVDDGPHAGRRKWVLRIDAPSRVAASHSRGDEFRILRVAHRAGVRVPEPLWACDDPAVVGRPFYVMRHLAGNASGRDLVQRDFVAGERERLLATLGTELATLHAVRPPHAELDFLPLPSSAPAVARIETYRAYLDQLPDPHPVLEWGLAWLAEHAPPAADLVLCHCDFRTGNYLVDGAELTAILDWEFAAWGDRFEDLGWFCARCWRFGAFDQEAGGIGARDSLYRAYQARSNHPVDHSQVRYWEVMAAVRWAIVALQQAERHLSGQQHSLELALTGRMVPEMELDILQHAERWEADYA